MPTTRIRLQIYIWYKKVFQEVEYIYLFKYKYIYKVLSYYKKVSQREIFGYSIWI